MGKRNRNKKWHQPTSKNDTNRKKLYDDNTNVNLFLHPELLAQQAAAMRKTTATNQIYSSINEENKNKKKNKKRQLNVDANSNSEDAVLALRKKMRKKPTQESNILIQKQVTKDNDGKVNGNSNSIDSSKTVYLFGQTKWRRSEQLIRTILYPTLLSKQLIGGATNNNRCRMKFVFLQSDTEDDFHLVRQYASMLKPVLHPSGTSFACHGKVRRHQIDSILRQIITKEKSLLNTNENNDGNKNSNHSTVLGSVFFVSDSSIAFLLSIMRKLIRSKRTASNKSGNIDKNIDIEETMNITKSNEKIPLCIHYHTPLDTDTFQLRCQVVEEFQNLIIAFSSGKNKSKSSPSLPGNNATVHHVALDGNQSEDNDKSHNNSIILKSLANTPKYWTDIVMDDKINFNIQKLIIPSSERSKCQAIVNSAFKLTRKMSSVDSDIATRSKLMAHLSSIITGTTSNNEKNNNSQTNYNEPKYSTNETIRRMKILGMIVGDDNAIIKGNNNDTLEGKCLNLDQTNIEKHRNSLQTLKKKQLKNVNTKSHRESAWTCWLDRKEGKDFGGAWEGTVRQGASGENASRSLAKLLETCKFSSTSKKSIEKKQISSMTENYCGSSPDTYSDKIKFWSALKHWNPNPMNEGQNRILHCMVVDDTDRGGGNCNNGSDDDAHDFGDYRCGKACGHNETTMFYLRPFQPLEVLNSRVCSKQSPAPGNVGFEGCLDFLRRLCASNQRGMTFWDTECFAYIDGTNGKCVGKKKKKLKRKTENQNNNGQLLAPVHKLFKKDLLTSLLTTSQLSWIMIALRQWTLYREHASSSSSSNSGDIASGCHPKELLNGIVLVHSYALKGTIEIEEIQSTKTASNTVSKQSMNDINSTGNIDFLDRLPHSTLVKLMEFVLPGNHQIWKSIGPIRF